MPRKGLSINEIVEAATSLVEEKGLESFSLRELASRLDIKPASLYNHVANVDEITIAVGRFALSTLYDKLHAIQPVVNYEERLLMMADAYREYALNNPELYKAIVRMPSYEDELLKEEGHSIMNELYGSLERFQLSHTEKIHFGRMYRSAMHGFVSLEMNGYFQNEPDVNESYHFLMNQIIKILQSREA